MQANHTPPIVDDNERLGIADKTGTPFPNIDGFIRERECAEVTGLSRTSRWRLERAGEFPKRRRLSSGAIGWLRSEIAAWVASRQTAEM
jgi:prophage regulatory protein